MKKDVQYTRDYAFRFARWQHLAMGRRAMSVVPVSTCYNVTLLQK